MIIQTRDIFTLNLAEYGGRLTKEAVDRLERSYFDMYISGTGKLWTCLAHMTPETVRYLENFFSHMYDTGGNTILTEEERKNWRTHNPPDNIFRFFRVMADSSGSGLEQPGYSLSRRMGSFSFVRYGLGHNAMDLFDRFFEIQTELSTLAGPDVDTENKAEIQEMLVSWEKSHAPSPAALHLIKGLKKNELKSVKEVIAELFKEAQKIKSLAAQLGQYGSSVSSNTPQPLPMNPPVLAHPQPYQQQGSQKRSRRGNRPEFFSAPGTPSFPAPSQSIQQVVPGGLGSVPGVPTPVPPTPAPLAPHPANPRT
jgi:hypothetical protein